MIFSIEKDLTITRYYRCYYHSQVTHFEPSDISNVIKFIEAGTIMQTNTDEKLAKKVRRDELIEFVRSLSWFEDIDIFDDNNWFQCMPLWIRMQREIDEYNLYRGETEYQSQHKAKHRPKKKTHRRKRPPRRNMMKSKKPRATATQSKPKPKPKPKQQPRPKQMLQDATNPPNIRNLCVIPICSFQRTHYTMDTDTILDLLCAIGIAPRKDNRNITPNNFRLHKEEHYNQYFNLRKIKRFVRGKKEFSFLIRSDGVSVSIDYKFEKKEPINHNPANIVQMVRENRFKKMLGIDPGIRKWNSTVQHDIETGVEVNCTVIFA